MKRLALIALTVAACKPVQKEAGLVAVVSIPGGAESKCLQLELSANGAQRLSPPGVIGNKSSLFIGVAQGSFPEMVELRALGFVDEGCKTRSREESATVTSGFGRDPVPTVSLTLKKLAPKNETNCGDGLDDDADRAIDCADSDCDAQPCTSTLVCVEEARCTNGMCGGGRMKTCDRPPNGCFATAGSCVPSDGGCAYQLLSQGTCTDQDLCTTQDRCLDDGGCTGVPVTCAQTTNSCLEAAGSCADGGCAFTPKADAGCDDGDNCTVTDSCSNGSCSGTTVRCEATSCRTVSSRCEADGGCIFSLIDAGTPCDGGLCSIAGDCLPRFPYQPVNFDVVQLRAPPAAPTVLDCGETIIDTTGPGIPRPTNWCRNQPFEASYIPQPGGPSALLVSMSSLNITVDGGLVLKGDKPVIFGVFGDVSILGRIVTTAGSHTCTAGVGPDGSGSVARSGGGGGGFRGAGGRGGNGTGVTGPAGGATETNLGPSPLRSGCPGGRGGNAVAEASRGGGGFQLSAGGVVSLNGVIAAPGFGGAGGRGGFDFSGGNGAGSGGLLILEANELVITAGALTANGGGGGEAGGLVGGGDSGGDGTQDSNVAATGGGDSVPLGGNGGKGGTGADPADGQDNGSGGGGGGSSGLIFIRGASTCSIGPSVLFSPPREDAGCP